MTRPQYAHGDDDGRPPRWSPEFLEQYTWIRGQLEHINRVLAPCIVGIRQRVRDMIAETEGRAGDAAATVAGAEEDGTMLVDGDEEPWSREVFRVMAVRIVAQTRERMQHERQSSQALLGMSRLAGPRTATPAPAPPPSLAAPVPIPFQGPTTTSPSGAGANDSEALALLALGMDVAMTPVPGPPPAAANAAPVVTASAATPVAAPGTSMFSPGTDDGTAALTCVSWTRARARLVVATPRGLTVAVGPPVRGGNLHRPEQLQVQHHVTQLIEYAVALLLHIKVR